MIVAIGNHLSIAELLLRPDGVTARSEDSRTALIIGPNIPQ